MTFRDEREAAWAKANALQQELEEAKAKLAERDVELGELGAELAKRDAELARQRDESEDARRVRDARDRKRKRRADARETSPTVPKKGTPHVSSASEAEQRVMRSISLGADAEAKGIALFFVLPGFWLYFYFAIHFDRVLVALLAVAASVWTLSMLIALGLRARAERRVRKELAWVKERPYELVGYPSLLGVKPADANGERSGHRRLELELVFSGAPPSDLRSILRAFDGTLIFASSRCRRESPVTLGRRGRYGSSYVVDANPKVRRWVRDLDKKVLRPLHHAHGLTRAEIRLV